MESVNSGIISNSNDMKAFEAAQLTPKGITAKFVSKTQEKNLENADVSSRVSTYTFGVAGMVGIGAVLSLGAGVAVATPIGWAALGVAAIGLLCLGIRHVCMKRAGIEPKSIQEFGRNLMYAAGGFCCASCGGDRPVDEKRSYWLGFSSKAIINDGPVFTLKVPSSSDDKPESQLVIYEGDQWHLDENGDIAITRNRENIPRGTYS